ncbi:putative pentatricopeptide [Rosa chinensis]|uniref:Putative pentatricopeptide n=1 Tax=Rosa chinensis TaxID=74649 RepID=A0A2P6R840_ROSCH|nr:pentatricopeptide repeat-containing protein At4g38150 [Rosa chinensis]PRQ42581.1 putative pentatricopeptide [Rosa chinensis]
MMKFKVDFTGAGSSGGKDDDKPILTLGTAKLKVDQENKTATFIVDQSKLPARPYSSKPEPITVGPEDPTDLRQVFQKVETTEGIINNVVKMFDALLTKGHEREAAEMHAQIDQGFMPEVVTYTGVMEEYAGAGKTGDVLKVYQRMLDYGINPNSYTYRVLIKALAEDPDSKFLGDAKKYLMEMMDVCLRPDAVAYTAVFKAFARLEKAAEGRRFLEEMKGKGFVADEKEVREVLKGRRGRLAKKVINLLFGK